MAGPTTSAVRVRGLPACFGAGLRATAHQDMGVSDVLVRLRSKTPKDIPKPLEGSRAFISARRVMLANGETVTYVAVCL